MSTSTDFIGLTLTDALETSMSFLDWRLLMNGTQGNSNMKKIDDAIRILSASASGKADGFSFNPATGVLQLKSGLNDIPGASVTINVSNISKSALSSEVQASLDLADSALQADDISGKLDVNQGIANYKKVMEVGANGELSPQPRFNSVLYYSSLYSAISDANIGFSGGTDIPQSDSNAKVRANIHIDGSIKLTLLANVTESQTCNPEVDIVIDLSGYTITVTSSLFMRRVSSSKANITIDGRTTNSTIVMNGISGASATLIQWGTDVDAVDDISELKILGGTYNNSSNSKQSIAFFILSGKLITEDCNVSVSSTYYDAENLNNYHVSGIYLYGRVNATVCRCTINATYSGAWDISEERYLFGNAKTYGILNYSGVLVADSCTIAVDTHYPTVSTGDAAYINLYTTGIINYDNAKAYLRSCSISGMHSAVDNLGELYVDGGIYQARGHGGFYFEGSKIAMVQNATIREGSYEGNLRPAGATGGFNHSAFYVGGSSTPRPTIFLDHCVFDSTSISQYISFRNALGARLYISNSPLANGRFIRIDQLSTPDNMIYAGTGCNQIANNILLRIIKGNSSSTYAVVSQEIKDYLDPMMLGDTIVPDASKVLSHIQPTLRSYSFNWDNLVLNPLELKPNVDVAKSAFDQVFDKIDAYQGVEHAGKALTIGADGYVVPGVVSGEAVGDSQYQKTGAVVEYVPAGVPTIVSEFRERQSGYGLPNIPVLSTALYTELMNAIPSEPNVGDLPSNPITYVKNETILLRGKYYSQSAVTYTCIRNSETPVNQDLASLVGTGEGKYVLARSGAILDNPQNYYNIRPLDPVSGIVLSVNTDVFMKSFGSSPSQDIEEVTAEPIAEGKYNWNTGELREAFGRIVFDGSPEQMARFSVSTSNQRTTLEYSLPTSDSDYGYGKSSGISRCSHFITQGVGSYSHGYNMAGLSSNGHLYIFCYNAPGETAQEKKANLAAFFQYEHSLGTPVTVEYELASARVTSGTETVINTFDGTNVAKGRFDLGDVPSKPITYVKNSTVLLEGKYYSQDDVTYVCILGSAAPINGDLDELVDIFVSEYDLEGYVEITYSSSIITVSGEIDHNYLFGNDVAVGNKGILSGKTAVFFGDSITGNYRPPYDYPSYIAKYTGLNVINAGFGGCHMTTSGARPALSMAYLASTIKGGNWDFLKTYTQNDSNYIIKYWGDNIYNYVPEKLDILANLDWNTVDYILINYGSNDFRRGTALDNGDNPEDQTTVLGAIRYSIRSILQAYPHIKIMFVTPLWRWWDEHTEENPNGVVSFTDSSTWQNSQNKTLKEYCDAIRELVTEKYQIPCFDLYRNCGFNEYNRHQYFAAYDGTHPFPYFKGFEHIGRLISGFMMSPNSGF